MKIIRWLAGGVLMLCGGYLGLVSLIVGYAVQNQAMVAGSARQWFLFARVCHQTLAPGSSVRPACC